MKALTLAAAISSACVLTVAAIAGSVLVYRASVHEQNCLSYEKQMISAANKMVNAEDKALSMLKDIQQNPFMAFGYLPQLPQMMGEVREMNVASNNTLYAYVGTCGEQRKSDFFARPEVASVFNAVIYKAAEIQNFAETK